MYLLEAVLVLVKVLHFVDGIAVIYESCWPSIWNGFDPADTLTSVVENTALSAWNEKVRFNYFIKCLFYQNRK